VTVDREAIERRAEELLARVPAYVWDGDSLPVPVERIADSWFGLLIRDVPDLWSAPGAPSRHPDQTLSGLLLPDAGEIWVNAQEARQWPGRRRFTIGHELGHHVMHRDDGRSLYCRSRVVEEEEPAERPRPPVPEQEANVFAAALLMPHWLISRDYKRGGMDFAQLCGRYGASMAAMSRRMRTVIPARTDGARWSEIDRDLQYRLLDRWARHLDRIDADVHRRRVSDRRVLVYAARNDLATVLNDPNASPEAILDRGGKPETLWAGAVVAARRGARGAAHLEAATASAVGLRRLSDGEDTYLAAAARCAERGIKRRD
jgi:IrrE N-terminal-like domain